jgi:hypothetical protein
VTRVELATSLAQCHRALGETLAGRRERWFQAYEHALSHEPNITAVKARADYAVHHLDAECDRLRGEIEALKVELAHLAED